MFGPMNKGAGTAQPQQQPQMQPGGQQPGMQMPGGLAALFQNLQQPQQTQVPQISAPQYGPPLMPSPEQARAATQARMLARTPPPPVVTAPTPLATAQQQQQDWANRERRGGSR